jgi:anaerobic ribonucleoside-triphosphate reductase
MNYAEICIIKRDGKREDFSISKIKNAISKAFSASGIQDEQQLVADITMNVISQFSTPTITVEEIQDLVEKSLMKVRPEVAKKYIIYREWRNTERDKKTQMKQVMDGIVAIDKNDVNLSNANMSSHTPAGQMMTFASEVTKDYTYKYLLPKRFAEAHQLGDIHIHDLDYYPTKTTTCIQYDMDDLFERGFRTKNGSIRTPQSMLRWLPSSFRPTKMSSMADRRFRLLTSSWQKEWPNLSASIWHRSLTSMWLWKTEIRPMKNPSVR